MKGFSQSEMLFSNDTTTNPLLEVSFLRCQMSYMTYRSEQCPHEKIAFFARGGIADLQYAHGEAWNDSQMFPETVLDHITEFVIVLQCANFRHFSQLLECRIVQLVNMTNVRIRQCCVRQGLHIPEPMCNALALSAYLLDLQEQIVTTGLATQV